MEKTDIIITATFDFPPENIEKIVKTSKDLIEGALDEVGCQAYSWALDPYVPGRIWVMERWESEQSLKDHFDSNWYKDMSANLHTLGILGGDAFKYKVTKTEPVYDTTGVPRADFFSED
tara:strand:- start:416 stop:772 length:357 start_codon:yes stop_codon:yes gene_type:complete